MSIRPDEISSILKEEIQNFDQTVETSEIGTVIEVGDGIARVHGLQNAMVNELLEFPGGVKGMAQNLEEDNIGCILLGEFEHIKDGDPVKRTGRIIEVPVGEALIGRVVNAIGEPIDGKGPIETTKSRPVENVAPGVITREAVHEPLQTGLKAIDALVPIGRGPGCYLHLRCDRPEGVDRCQRCWHAGRIRRHGLHHRRCRNSIRAFSNALHCTIRRGSNGRRIHV